MPIAPLFALALAATPQMQQPAPVTCPATPIVLTGELSGWAHARPVTAASLPTNIGAAILQPGVRADVTLLPSAQIAFAATPKKAPAAGSFSGMLGIDAARPGTYRIAVGSAAWVNVVGPDHKALTSIAHGHGPDCSGVRKTVDFALQSGKYVVQIEGNATSTIGVMVVARG